MKKFLAFIGGAVLLSVAALAVRLLAYAPEGRRLDATSKEYAVHTVENTLKNWNLTDVKAESSPEFLAVAPDAKLQPMLAFLADRLGPIQSHEEPKGESFRRTLNFRTVTTADYLVPVTFQKGKGKVALRFVLKDDQWRLLAFNVDSDGLFPQGTTPTP